MIVVDGTHEEGGGSILRLSLALSIYTGKPFRIVNIRKHRAKPGLNSQNLTSVLIAQKICDAKVVGAKRGSFELEFYPGKIESRNISIDIGSAGSIFLVLQAVFLPCVLSGKKFIFKIQGGTDVAWSPGYDYFKEVFLPFFENHARFDLTLQRRGYYPNGGGQITLKMQGFKDVMLKPIQLEKLGRLIAIRGVSNASKDLEQEDFADNEANNLVTLLKDYDVKANITRTYAQADCTGSGLLVYGIFEQEDKSLLRTGIFKVAPKTKVCVSEEVGADFKKLVEHNIPVDEFFADQLIPFLGIMTGRIMTTPIHKHLSKHLKANIYVVELFLDKKIKIHNDGLIECE